METTDNGAEGNQSVGATEAEAPVCQTTVTTSMAEAHNPKAARDLELWELSESFPLVDPAAVQHGWLDAGRVILNADRVILDINEAFLNWLKKQRSALIGQPASRLFGALSSDWERILESCWEKDASFSQARFAVNPPSGQCVLLLEFTRSGDHAVARFSSALPSVTELAESAWSEHGRSEDAQRKMFVRLIRAESQLENLVQRWPGVIFSQRPDFTFQFVSPKIEELTGVSRPLWATLPERFWALVHEADVDELRRQIKLASRMPEGVTTTYRMRHANTSQVAYVLEHRRAVLSGNGLLLGYEGVWLDVTRQTIAEKRLSSAAWKETLAVLTMGLAHDFSNIMAGIHSLSESYLSQVNSRHPFYEGLSLIKQHSLQASQLVHRIIQLHHGKTGERNYHNLNDIVTDVVDLARKMLPRRVQVTTRLAEASLPLYVDAVEFCQVILNLTLNAADAMPNGGQLVFRTSSHPKFPPMRYCAGTLPRLPAICLAVEDTGCGIPDRHLPSVFDPFFTTKAMDKGSGLGLYNARLFVDKHQGAISVDSVEAHGTTFGIWLPEADFSEAERALTTADGQRSSLLLVGGLNEILESTTECFRTHGYHVVTAHTREEATRCLDSGEHNFVGVYVLANPREQHLDSLLTVLRPQLRRLKTFVQIIGCNQDELSTHWLEQFDVILTPELSEAQILHKVQTALAEKE